MKAKIVSYNRERLNEAEIVRQEREDGKVNFIASDNSNIIMCLPRLDTQGKSVIIDEINRYRKYYATLQA